VAKKIGELLIEAHVITPEQLEHALALQRNGDRRKLGQLLIELRIVTETQLTQGLSRQLSVPWVSLYHIEFSRSLLSFVPQDVAEKYCLVPIFVRKTRKGGETLYVAMDDPTNEQALRDVERNAGVPVRPMIACPSDIRSAIRVYYAGEAAPAAPVPQPASAVQAAPGPASGPASTPRVATPAPKPAAASPVVVAAARPAAAYSAPVAAAAIPAPASASVPDRDSAPEIDPIPESEEEIETEDAPDSAPEIQATELELKPRSKTRTLALTLLDGTTIQLPTPRHGPAARDAARDRDPTSDLTARDLVSALRAVAHGVDASEILGEAPRWEAMFAALLSLLLRKGLVADWEFVEEYRKV
jgi:type IV pilus assembly protein PilB